MIKLWLDNDLAGTVNESPSAAVHPLDLTAYAPLGIQPHGGEPIGERANLFKSRADDKPPVTLDESRKSVHCDGCSLLMEARCFVKLGRDGELAGFLYVAPMLAELDGCSSIEKVFSVHKLRLYNDSPETRHI